MSWTQIADEVGVEAEDPAHLQRVLDARWVEACAAREAEEAARYSLLLARLHRLHPEVCDAAANRVTGRESVAQEAWDRQAELLDGVDLPDLEASWLDR